MILPLGPAWGRTVAHTMSSEVPARRAGTKSRSNRGSRAPDAISKSDIVGELVGKGVPEEKEAAATAEAETQAEAEEEAEAEAYAEAESIAMAIAMAEGDE